MLIPPKPANARVPITVLASGRGTNFQAIAEAARSGQLSVEIVALVSDNPKAGALEIAERFGIPTQVVLKKPRDTQDDHDARVLYALTKEPRFLVLAGYRRILSQLLIERFRNEKDSYTRIVNVHPSLLPSFPGLQSYKQAFQYGAKVTGVTVHLVEQEVDSGPILAQEAFSISDCKTPEEVEERGLAIEHRLYPQTLSWFLQGRFHAVKSEGRIHVRPS